MFAELRLFSVFAILIMSCGLNAQCPPIISSPSDKLSLEYPIGSVPTNLDKLDTDLTGNLFDFNDIMLVEIVPTWQTFGPNFTGAVLTGDITIHYIDGSTEDCEYNEGSLVGLVPVELSLFDGVLKNDNIVLSWVTESEQDNLGFEVERSFDGERFSVLGMVAGFGDSEESQEYSYLDTGVRNRALSNTVYYRLVQIDLDGSKTYSEVKAVDLGLNFEQFEITKITGWDSAERKILVHFYNPSTIRKIKFMVTDINGRVIEQRSIFPEDGLNVFEVDLSLSESPFYFLSLNNGKEVIGEKVALGVDY